MKRFISYPHIEQYRNVISNINRMASYKGQDDDGEPIYDHQAAKPVITFRGTIKLHGTNSGVIFNSHDGIWAQSRKNIITPEKDNAGFAFYVESHKEEFQKLFDVIKEREGIDTTTHNIAIFGEWAGKGIQKGVSISALDKMMVIFGVKIAPYEKNPDVAEQDEVSRWVSHTDLRDHENKIYNIEDYESFELEIDFNRPDIAQAKMIELVAYVEKECPVGKAFGVKADAACTIGEGLVWKGWFKNCQLMFKTKGEKHSASNVKTVAEVDVAKMNSIHEFVDYAVTNNRMEQAVEQVFTITSTEPNIRKMGDFLRWVVNDVTREEIDVMKENNLEPKEINKYISTKARNWFSAFLDSQAGLANID